MGSNELEICVLRSSAHDYDVQLRLDRDGTLTRMVQAAAAIDLQALDDAASPAQDPSAYGAELFRQLFCAPELRAKLEEARGDADDPEASLRLRLYLVESAAKALHGLRWERLCDPATRRPLLLDRRILFSRYLSSQKWTPVRLRPRRALRALIVVASPSDLDRYGLNPIDAAAEVQRAREGLRGVECTEICGPDTLRRMTAALRDEHDILYLVCHGGRSGRTGEPSLWLERADGMADVRSGDAVVEALSDLPTQPRLVVLASCGSAGDGGAARDLGPDGGLSAIGPKLAEVGLPAVLAMQGSISVASSGAFMSAFFDELARDGCVDRAAAVARSVAAAVRPDEYWVPVLFTRIRNGCIWRSPAVALPPFEGWPGLLAAIKSGSCTPILGPGLLEGVCGKTEDLAKRWAQQVDPDIALLESESLPRVAQAIAVDQEHWYVHHEFAFRLREEVRRRAGGGVDEAAIDAALKTAQERGDWAAVAAGVNDLLERVRGSATGRLDPIAEVARLPFKIYLTTGADDQLERALTSVGKNPVSEVCRWHDRSESDEWPRSLLEPGGGYQLGDPARPLVYHLYGRLDFPDSLVLTEDDCFDFLRGPIQRPSVWVFPEVVRVALRRSALMFLGFQMAAWDFRVLYRSLLAQHDGGALSRRFNHIAVQVDPEEGRAADPVRARKDLERYFASEHVHFFWGHLDDFMRGLAREGAAR